MKNIKQNMAIFIFFLFSQSIFANAENVSNQICKDIDSNVYENAGWMSSNWGIRIVLPGGNSKSVEDFHVNNLINQIEKLRSISWVMVNLNAGSIGCRFTAPLPKKTYSVDIRMAPERDLLYEVLFALKSKGLKTIVYIAAQGPLSENVTHWASPISEKQKKIRKMILNIREKWIEHSKFLEIHPNDLWADLLRDYSIRYQTLIDGWWFDYGNWGNSEKLVEAVRAGNRKAAIGWNKDHGNSKETVPKVFGKGTMPKWILSRSNSLEDFTAGHPTPPEVRPPWWQGNYELVSQIANNCSINGALGHIFMPMQKNWRSGEPGFNNSTIIKWTSEVIKNHGAITWAVALREPEFKYSSISKIQLQQLIELDQEIIKLKKGFKSRTK